MNSHCGNIAFFSFWGKEWTWLKQEAILLFMLTLMSVACVILVDRTSLPTWRKRSLPHLTEIVRSFLVRNEIIVYSGHNAALSPHSLPSWIDTVGSRREAEILCSSCNCYLTITPNWHFHTFTPLCEKFVLNYTGASKLLYKVLERLILVMASIC